MEVSPLGAVEPARDFDESLYKETLKQLQKQLSRLHNKLYLRKIPVVIVYEGWDAAGKGGNIKRVTAALDPRGYEVVPIAAPTPDELRHHYLWRFWNQLPKTGHIAINGSGNFRAAELPFGGGRKMSGNSRESLSRVMDEVTQLKSIVFRYAFNERK